MKRLITSYFQRRILIKFILSSFLLFSQLIIFGQTWDGGGDGTSWNDPQNWDTNNVPAATAVVTIGGTVNITGTVPSNPSNITLTAGANVTMNLTTTTTIGNNNTTQDCFNLGAGSSLTLSSNFILNPPNTRDAFDGNSTNNLVITINGILTVNQALNGFVELGSGSAVYNNGGITLNNIATDGITLPAGSTFSNSASLSINNTGTSDGIENFGTFSNDDIINITNAGTNGIYNRNTGIFNNNGTLTISGANIDDNIYNQGQIINYGDISATNSGTGSANNCIEIATGGSLSNESNATITVNGGPSTQPRAISVIGTLTNNGIITLSGGNLGRTLSNDGGTITNNQCAFINLANTRINNNSGTLINNGYIRSDHTSNGMLNTGTATNNGFFWFTVATASTWVGTDNGVNIRLSPFGPTGSGACTHDLSSVGTNNMNIYSWKYGSTSLGNNDAAGILTLPGGSIFPGSGAGPYIITQTQCPNYSALFNIQIKDVCAATLPVELITFDASQVGKNVMLDWSLQQNGQNDHFVIESSSDGTTFEGLGKVNIRNVGVTIQKYSFVDPSPFDGANYYRIKQVDKDGMYSYSKVVYVPFTLGSDNGFGLVPNFLKSGQALRIVAGPDFGAEDYLLIGIFDASGHLVQKQEIRNLDIDILNTSELTAGLYVVKALNRSDFPNRRFIIIN